MPQTFYIENDEEIISVIGRLRQSSSEENYFIFPKRSLVLQSVINLRLFQREAEKLGKKVIVVTQDETGKALAEKAGLLTENYSDDFSRKNNHLELAATPAEKKVSVPRAPLSEKNAPRSEELGSSDFYSGTGSNSIRPVASAPATPPLQTLRVRNASPEKQTSLNSTRFAEQEQQRMMSTQKPPVAMPSRGEMTGGTTFAQAATPARETRLKNFFGNGGMQSPAPVRTTPERKPVPASPSVAVGSKKVKGIFLLLGGVSFLSLVGVLVFLFLPKAEVRVIPYKITQNVDLQFDGRSEGVIAEENILPVRVIEKQEEVVFSANATGTSTGTAQKARGTVVIYNRNGSDPQSLVATTRLEAPDGKVFRLVSGVTVPGMTNGQPGAIEASVVADQVGSEYNIAATTFTIPGFKGSPKYDKFSAQSSKAMAGGGDASGADLKIISKEDIEKAETQAKEKAKQAYLDAVQGELLGGERVLEENLDIVPTGTLTPPLSGTVATSFEYRNAFRVRGFIFSEEAIKQKITESGESKQGNVTFQPKNIALSYGEAIPDYDAKKIRLKVHATIDAESVIDTEKLRSAIAGKSTDEINAMLASFPEIKKIEIVFKPQWFSSTVPSSESRVTVVVEPGSAN